MKRKLFIIVLLSVMLSACTSLGNYFKPVSKYDQKSYENMTYLKADVLMFYDTLNTGVDEDIFLEFKIRFNRMKEYEFGKKGNEEIADQLAIIFDLFSKHCDEVRVKPYSEVMLANKKEIIGIAFDILIETEESKRR